jgi:hypothetical protein
MSAVGAKAAAAAGAASATAAVALDAASAALPAASCAQAGVTAAKADAKPPATPKQSLSGNAHASPFPLECSAVAGLARADAHGLTDIENKDLAVADGAAVRGSAGSASTTRSAMCVIAQATSTLIFGTMLVLYSAPR